MNSGVCFYLVKIFKKTFEQVASKLMTIRNFDTDSTGRNGKQQIKKRVDKSCFTCKVSFLAKIKYYYYNDVFCIFGLQL